MTEEIFKMRFNKAYVILSFITVVLCFFIMFYPVLTLSSIVLILATYLFFKDSKLGIFFLLFSALVIDKLIIIVVGYQIDSFFYYSYLFSILFIFLNKVLHKKRVLFADSILDKTLFLFSIVLIVSIHFVSTDKAYGFEKFQLYLTSIVLFYLPVLLTKQKNDIFVYYEGIFYFGLILVIFGIIQLLGYETYAGKHHNGRLSILSLNPIWVGRYLSYSILVEIYMIIKYCKTGLKNVTKLIIVSAVGLLQLSLIILTGSRGPLLALLIAGSYYVISRQKFNFRKIIPFLLGVVLIITLILMIIPTNISERILNLSSSGQITVLIRVLANIEAYNNFKENIFQGIGFGSYKFGNAFLGKLIYPHNVFMEMLSETGIFGFLLFLFIVFYPVILFWRRIEKLGPDLSSLIFSLFIAAFINANISGHIGANYYLWFSMGVMYSSINLTKSNLSPSSNDSYGSMIIQ